MKKMIAKVELTHLNLSHHTSAKEDFFLYARAVDNRLLKIQMLIVLSDFYMLHTKAFVGNTKINGRIS